MKIFVWLDEPSSHEIESAEIAEIVGGQIGDFADSVSRVMVSIRDTNAQKGGIDKICRVTTHLRWGDVITVSQHSEEIAAAAGKACDRMHSALNKAVQRKKLYRQRSSFAGKIKTDVSSKDDDRSKKN